MQTRCFKLKEDAREYEIFFLRTRQRVRAGLEPPVERIRFSDFTAVWRAKRNKSHPDSTTSIENARLDNTWIPIFGPRYMDTIRRGEVEAELGRLTCGPATRNRHRSLLHAIFAEALRRDPPCVEINPITNIPVLSERGRRDFGHFKNEEQAEAYIAGMYEHGLTFGAASTVMIFCGPRVRELLALRWGDIDEKAGCITVSRIIEAVSGEEKERTKGQGVRGKYSLPLYPRVKQALDALRASRTFPPRAGDSIFLIIPRTRTEVPMSYTLFTRRHNEVIAAKSLPWIAVHGLRHTAQTLLQRAGLSRDERHILAGHADPKTTDRYSHADLNHVIEKAAKQGFGVAREGLRLRKGGKG